MVERVEYLWIFLQIIFDFEVCICGFIVGFMMFQFVVDFFVGGGKCLVCLYELYDFKIGLLIYMVLVVMGCDKENKVYEYYDFIDIFFN